MKLKSVIPLLLLIIGWEYSQLVAHAQWPPKRGALYLLAALAVVSCIPPVARRIGAAIDLLRNSSRRAQWLTALLITIAAFVTLYAEARHQQRTFIPKYQDEFSYLIQARMLAHGRLWMPAHELAPFFTSFQLLAEPVYASIYFPGAAMVFAPGVWFGLPFWVMPLLASALAVGLIYLVFTELIDGVGGILGAVMLIALPMFRLTSIMALAQAPTIMLALATILAWLRWRESMVTWRAAVLGACAGWLAITRPVDALCVLAPVGMAMLFELRHRERRLGVRSIAAVVLAALPFLALQIAFDVRVTANPLRTPFDYFADLCYPQTSFGFHHYDPAVRPKLDLPQVQKFYEMHAQPYLEEHSTLARTFAAWRDKRLAGTVLELSPGAMLMIFAPVGFLGLIDRRRWVVSALFPMFVLLYFFYVFYLPHYVVIAAPAMLLMIALGAHVVRERVGLRTVFIPLAIFGLAVMEMSWFNKSAWDEPFVADELIAINRTIEQLPQKPAIVLFRFTETNNPHVEPVYNIDVIWPDDARVIRAHDRGDDRNVKLFEYYAKRQPDRVVYRYDRGDGSITRLGTVAELATRL